MTAPTVFISYSHKDEEWKDRVVTHLRVLEMEGMLDVWDDRRIEAGNDWKTEIENAINAASIAVLLISANFLTSKFIRDEEVSRFLARRATDGVRVIPLILKPCAWQQVGWLSKIQGRPKDNRPLSAGNENQIDTDLAALANEVAAIIKRAGATPDTKKFIPLHPDKVSLAKLPSTDRTLFGRKKELEQLNEAWADPKINIVSLVAWGGVGKSALVNRWLSDLGESYGGAERVYGWSFYSQGAAEGRQVSADQFIAAALTWFGDPDPTQGSPWDKGERLAELIKAQRTLLILDGLEPLQNPPPVETGKIKDPSLTSLLRELARQNPGLVVISTRLAVDDLKDFVIASEAKQSPRSAGIASTEEHRLATLAPGASAGVTGTMVEIDLDSLSDESGAAYLKFLGVDGTDQERAEASHDFGGHALALTLLGRYLKVVHNGDIRKRGEIPHVMDEQKQGAHARRVMDSYERWLKGKPELDILRLMGLFDRPAEKGALDALRKEPAIPSLTDALQKMNDAQWKYAVNDLRELRLLAPEDPHAPDELDCHPLLREHFGEKLKAENLKAWQEAHGRLYEYYKSTAKEFPDTLEEMAPLYAAVMHGCQAGKYQEAFWEVFYQRIRRKEVTFSLKKLGSTGIDLATLSGFYVLPWRKTVDGLIENHKGYILNDAGYDLRALGRLKDAVQPMLAGLESAIEEKHWPNASRAASTVSELYLTIGDVTRALTYAEQSVQFADLSGSYYERVGARIRSATANHQLGNYQVAEDIFRMAEEILKNAGGMRSLLYSSWGYRYCDLLLSIGRFHDSYNRTTQTIRWTEEEGNLLEIALEYLALGRALFQIRMHVERVAPIQNPLIHLNRAMEGFRRLGEQEFIVLGLLARAEYYRLTGDLVKAQKDVDEAFTIATRGGMGLHLADCHLEYARLFLAHSSLRDGAFPSKQSPRDESGIASQSALAMTEKAREHLTIAKEMINKMGYHRRDKEVEELEEILKT